MSPPYIQDLLKEKDIPYDLRASKIQVLVQPKHKSTTHCITSLRYHGIKLRNRLPEQGTCTESVSQFQSLFNKHIMQTF